jgi:hypothetical protein
MSGLSDGHVMVGQRHLLSDFSRWTHSCVPFVDTPCMAFVTVVWDSPRRI